MDLPHYNLKTFLVSICEQFGFSSIAILPLKNSNLNTIRQRLASAYNEKSFPDSLKYIQDTIPLRADPLMLFPWAETIIFVSIPFHRIPAKTDFVPQRTPGEFSGIIAGYGSKMDYHSYTEQKLIDFSLSLKAFLKQDFKSEICVDTKPIAEKILAEEAGLGKIGFNSCLICPAEGSGCCIGCLVINCTLPSFPENKLSLPCDTCRKCIQHCPTGALTGDIGNFNYQLCRSYLSMEKRETLSPDEIILLGEWVFGCDVCTQACPESKLPEPVHIDLEWLLLSSSSAVRDKIHNTPLEHAGVTLLRRNALYVLNNKPSENNETLIRKFIKSSGSNFLKNLATVLLTP